MPTRQWLQLISLTTLFVAVACNSVVGWFLLPHGAHTHRAKVLFRVWFWLDEKGSMYGWMPIILGLLAWDHFIYRRTKLKGPKPKIKRWITRKVLTFVVAAAAAPLLPWWIPAGQPPAQFLSLISKHPGLPSLLAWVSVVVVLSFLCVNVRTRDSLLGQGRVLSLVSVGFLFIVFVMTLIGWSLSF